MSTIHPDNEATDRKRRHVHPMWFVTVFEKESHTNGETYYVRAPSRAVAVCRAVLLHPDVPFEKITAEGDVHWMDRESGYGLDCE